MQKPTIILLFLAVIALIAGAIYLPQLTAEPDAPVMHWDASDEVDGSQDTPDPAAAETADIDRTTAEVTQIAPVRDNEPRIQATLRGRVLNKFQQPVAGAKVWLEIGQANQGRGGRGGRGNRPRRIPEPVITNAEGLFAFQGEAFRNLQVSLQVKHDSYAVGLFTEPVGDILANAQTADSAEVNLKDVVLKSGGQVRGRVTDLDGNPVANAAITMEPDGRNPLRWQRNREELLPALNTDGNGYYAFPNVPAEGGNTTYTVSALAKLHTPGRSASFDVAEDQAFDVPDIQLGPGYEVTGFVRDQQGRPIANANVNLRSTPQRDRDQTAPGAATPGGNGGMRGMRAAFGRGRDHRAKTDEEGKFFIEHLPGTVMELSADAAGFLDYKQEGIDVKLGQLIQVAMDDGLRITGVVKTPGGAAVTSYAVRAVRLRGLPDPNLPALDMNEVMTKMRKCAACAISLDAVVAAAQTAAIRVAAAGVVVRGAVVTSANPRPIPKASS
jgi:protocatechuate 3,4-dioxygenase beta subunit